MTTKTTLSQLRRHAGLDDSTLGQIPTISDCTWLPNGLANRIAEAADDVIRVLGDLNREINGDIPSENENTEKDELISREIVFLITEIIRLLRSVVGEAKDTQIKGEFVRQERRISTAWYGILSGDIDDIQQYVADEERTR